MNKIKAFIPNLLTLGNLLCGVLAIIVLLVTENLTDAIEFSVSLNRLEENRVLLQFPSGYEVVNFLLISAMALDFFDGFVARALKVDGALGAQLDSLADNVTFGVVPSLLMFWAFVLLSQRAAELGVNSVNILMSGITLLIALGACYRLAKFNIEGGAISYFKGLNTPSMTIFVLGVFDFVISTLSVQKIGTDTIKYFQLFILFISIVLPLLMVSNLPLMNLKFKDYTWKNNWYRYILVLASIATILYLIATGGKLIFALIFIIPFYILLSIIARKSFVH